MEDVAVRELKLDSGVGEAQVVEQMAKMERRIFPKHESMASTFEHEARRKNSRLLYVAAPLPQQQHQEDKHGGFHAQHQILVVGYVMFSFTSSVAASITKLAVRESFRKQGYGEALLKAAINGCRSRPISQITLHVDPEREAAVALYKKLGFKLDAVVQSYYAPGRDACRLFLDFDML